MICKKCGGDFEIYSGCVHCNENFCLDCINEYNMCDDCYKNQPNEWKVSDEEDLKNIQGNIIDIKGDNININKDIQDQESLF